MNGILLRLAGPLSSWGEAAAFGQRTTNAFPTRSAIAGLLAAALGRPRDHALAPHYDLPGSPAFEEATLTVRVDNPGTPHTDFHTAGGGRAHRRGLPTSAGGYRHVRQSTHISHRHYLAGAAFTLALQGPDPLLEFYTAALQQPRWAPYLGRRACPPTEPLLLRGPTPEPLQHLHTRAPLTLPHPPPPGQDTVPIHFLQEHPPSPDAIAHHELADTPEDFTPEQRRYRTRPVWRTTALLPAALYAGPDPLDRLIDYVQEAPA